MAWIRRYKQTNLISKISVDSNFTFSSNAWLCVFHCSHRLLCRKKSCTRLSVKIALISYWNDFSLIPLGIVLLRVALPKYAKILNVENLKRALYSTSVSMPLRNSSLRKMTVVQMVKSCSNTRSSSWLHNHNHNHRPIVWY